MLATCLEKSGAGIEKNSMLLVAPRLLADFEPVLTIGSNSASLLRSLKS